MKKIIAAALVSGSVLASSAQAAQDGAYLPYVGMDYTYSDANARFERPHYNSGSVNVGTMYNRFFGTEVFYQLSDSHKIRHETDKSKTSFQAYGLDLYGYLPFGCYGTFTLLGTANILSAKTFLSPRNSVTTASAGEPVSAPCSTSTSTGACVCWHVMSTLTRLKTLTT